METDDLFEVNDFQKECILRIQQVLDEYGIYYPKFKKQKRGEVIWLQGSIKVNDRSHEICIYEDEAEISFGNKGEYYICERPDYATAELLIEDFCRRLRKVIETGKPY